MSNLPWTFMCECGEMVAASDEAQLVLAAQEHVAKFHPVVGLVPSPADVLAMAESSPVEEAFGQTP